MRRLFLCLLLLFTTLTIHAQDDTPELDIPEPMPLVDIGEQNITHFLLIGAATRTNSNNPGLTDTLMIVSVNQDTNHVAVLSIPRDYHVYVPDVGMQKINQTYFVAERAEAGTGIDTLSETITYNFGVEIDYYVRVNFDSFPSLIDSVGGITMTVDCAIEDWRLIEPDMDIHVEENYEMFTLWSGLHHMDGDTALWYVRSRRTSSDLDRNRRQQDVMRALWRQIRSQGLLENFPQLWEQFNNLVETDLTLGDAINYLPLLTDLDPAGVDYFTIRINRQVTQGYTADEGRFVLTPIRDAMIEMMQQVVTPTTSSRLSANLPTIAIYNGSGIPNLDYVAAHRLEREGFRTIITGASAHPRNYNLIVDHTGASRNNPVSVIQNVLSVTDEGVQTDPDPQREYDFELYIGYTYQYHSCTYGVIQPELPENPTDESNAG